LGALAAALVYFISPFLVNKVFNVQHRNLTLAIASLQIGGVGILVRFIDNVFLAIFQGHERYDLAAKVTAPTNVLTILLSLLCVFIGLGVKEILLVSIVVLAASAVAKALLARRLLISGSALVPFVHRAGLKEILGFGFYSWLQNAVGLLHGNIDRFLIASFIDTSAVTYYTISLQLAMQVHSILARAFSFLFPFSAKASEQQDYHGLRRVYNKATLLLVVFSSGLVLPIFLMGHNILQLWLGNDFALRATSILQVLCVRFALLPLGIVNYHYLLGTGLVRFQTAISVVTASVNIFGMWLLIPQYGAIGAAIGLLFSLPFMVFTRLYIEKKLFNEVNVMGQLSYLLSVIVPFAGATAFLEIAVVPLSSLSILILTLGTIAIAGMMFSFSLTKLFQKIGWIPLQ
jgi:O-antigen/teichoic acid export membrane protein